MQGVRGVGDAALSSLRHDLRQYVAAGLALSQIDDAAAHGPGTPVQLDTIHTLFDQIGLLIEAIGDTRPPPTDVQLHEVVADCVRFAQATFTSTITARVASPATTYGDPLLVRRAVTNLLDNAAHAAGADGTVEVVVTCSGDECVVEVTDDGAGFGLAPTGSGHGLAVVTRAVRACHGRLEVVCGPEPGTTVRMALPTAREGPPLLDQRAT